MRPNIVHRTCLFVLVLVTAHSASAADIPARFIAQARSAWLEAQKAYTNNPASADLACSFARACFDLGENADNNTERANLAQQGIDACKKVLEKDHDSVAAHYYLGMNLGELARTRGIGALKLVNQMETEFKTAAGLDPKFDYAGPERNLGLLYRDAPSIGSIGSRSRAHKQLDAAIELAPDYPDNHLSLLEACVHWNDRNGTKRELTALKELWPKAKKQFAGPKWEPSWWDWNERFDTLKKKIGEPPRAIESPRGRED